jgi:hypothetical protein
MNMPKQISTKPKTNSVTPTNHNIHTNNNDSLQKAQSKKNIQMSTLTTPNNATTISPDKHTLMKAKKSSTNTPDQYIRQYEDRIQPFDLNKPVSKKLSGKEIESSGPNNPNSFNKHNIKSPNKEEKKPTLERKMTEKKLQNNYTSNNNNESMKKPSCICYSNYDESFIRNNICRFCNRYIENNSQYENTIKKKYQQQEMVSRPR